MPTHLNDHNVAPAVLSDEQFEEIRRLLLPGFELSSMMLADYKAKLAAAKAAAESTGTAGDETTQ